ncbi:MAG: phosphate/phosphite/phosphonate ABC transporter substrate-binding protein [Spirochaetota bacterium]
MARLHLAFFFSLALVAGCGGGDGVDISDLAAGRASEVYGQEDIKARGSLSENLPGEAINFGITPWDEPDKLREMYAPFVAYLSERMKINIRFMVAQEYQELLNDLRRGIIHIAAFSPGSYADALDSGIGSFADYVASTQNEGNSYYRGVIIAGTGYRDLQSLKGQSFAFVEKGSSSGYKFPLALLLAKGVDPYRHFSKVFYLGSHANVVDSVASGKVAAGATWDGYLERQMGKTPEKVRVMYRTEQIPYDAIVVSKKKGPRFARQLRTELLRINKESATKDGRKVLQKELGFPYSGYVVHPPGFYDVVRRTGNLVRKYKPPAETNVK